MLRRLCAELLGRADYLLMLARLTVLDWLAGPPPETLTDRAIREEGERIRKAYPEIDFDHPKQERQRSPSYGGRSVFGWERGQTSGKLGHIGGR